MWNNHVEKAAKERGHNRIYESASLNRLRNPFDYILQEAGKELRHVALLRTNQNTNKGKRQPLHMKQQCFAKIKLLQF